MKSFGYRGLPHGFLNRFLIPPGCIIDLVAVRLYLYRRSAADMAVTVIGAKPIFLSEIARHPLTRLVIPAWFLTYGMVKIFGTAGMALAFIARRNRRTNGGSKSR